MAEVTPILKDGDHEEANNNRHIFLLPILSKLCEKAALNQFMPHLVSHKKLTTNQSGNKRWHSTETRLIHTTDIILSAIDKKKTTAVVLLDMSKVFDSLGHGILQYKLQDVGVLDTALRWFNSYLSDRHQMVCIRSELSDALPVRNGVPQESIIGPVLFSIYVNDLPSIPQSCSAECYVDDNKLYMCFPVQDHETAMTNMNNDLLLVRNRCFDNFLLLNPDKTKLLIYGSRRMVSRLLDYCLSLLGKELVPTQTVKDLGVTFDCKLNLNEHILNPMSTCMSSLGQINRVKYAFKKDLLITIINSLVFSKLYYCSSVWPDTTDQNICKPQGIQSFTAHIISGTRNYVHVTPILKGLRWIPVKKQSYYCDALLVFKYMTGMAPSYLSFQFLSRGYISGRSTRQSIHLNIPLFKSTTGERTFLYHAVKL